jgi:signal transduction histidine kinase
MWTFGARSVSVVVRDQDTRRTMLWQLDERAADGRRPPIRRLELTEDQQAVWLFEDYGRVWQASLERSGENPTQVRVTEPDAWRLSRRRVNLPEAFLETGAFRDVTAVNMGMPDEWQARAYLFDARDHGGLERRLHFLEELAEQITPSVTNVFLLRRLRARAGAMERARVARELHDGAIQALYGIEMKIEAIRRESSALSADAELGEIQALLRHEVLSLRELMQALRPTDLDSSEQLPDVLASLVERFRRDTGISARFIVSGDRISLSPSRALEVVRIVQEALVNVRKHSHAQNVLVRLTAEHNRCRLIVEDDGLGFAFDGRLTARELDERRQGPAIIKERARIAELALAVDSAPGAGSRVELTFGDEEHA